MRILETEKLTKNFGGLAAVSGVDFHIDAGEIVGLIGPNGAGKTTLFNLISGSLAPSAGRTLFNGQDISGKRPYKICKQGIARTFQLVQLFGHLTARENVQLGSLYGKTGKPKWSEANEKSTKLLEFVGLIDKENAMAKDLTIANQKRLEVARALATGPKLLLLDEVMAGLNPNEVTEAIELVKRIRDKGITIFMIEHVMKAIMGISDRIIVLHYGNKIAEGKPAEIATHEKVIEIYLGT
jgi:branched-chain amino acid transport system ATP-binding protein